jgi:hypothetical protein
MIQSKNQTIKKNVQFWMAAIVLMYIKWEIFKIITVVVLSDSK